ncbi:Cdc6/Cdc18 family protein [Halobacterium litoreum]|uniref:Cdc6/Cdc18 family protein n=1 Tax=Halobacterium litoreum TaxID=2039234 RepID=A0ABD5NBB2_9EURY|nr:Cdc6/Cdc18 family protein [Halobacterium litoreum]UHH14813.1 orc1/cdc6 family replication initiation protein [Halobacterium litoreum]
MITDARAFQQEFVPQELYHRDGEIDALTSTLQPLADGVAGGDAFIFGPSGTGKTTLARHVVELLQRENLTLTSTYLNAMSNSSRADAFRALANDAGVANDLRRDGTPASAFADRLREIDGQVIAIVDEVHVLDDYRTLQSLWEMRNLTLLMVCLDEDRLFAEFDGQLQSRFGSARTIRLDRYSIEEMTAILRGRVKAGLQPGVIRDDTLRYIADLAAGDARRGIALLRASVEHAVDDERDEITADVVEAAKESARGAVRQSRVRRLGTDKRLLYEIIRDAGDLDGGTLHARYEDRAQDPVARGTRRKYLARLEEYDLIASEGNGRGKTYAYPHQ